MLKLVVGISYYYLKDIYLYNKLPKETCLYEW